MPITKSAKKALRQSGRRKERNLSYKIKIKDLTKKALILIKQNKAEELKQLLPTFYKAFDKAVKTGFLKKNTANRRKSLFARKLNALVNPSTRVEPPAQK